MERAPAGAALVVSFRLVVRARLRHHAPGRAGRRGRSARRSTAPCASASHFGETPTDLAFERGRVPCTQGAQRDGAGPCGRRAHTVALGRMRREVAASLDVAMPRETHTPLDRLLINLLPLYGPDGTGRVDAMRRPLIDAPTAGPPSPRPPPQTTRAVASLLTQFAGNADALAALGACRCAVGIARRAWPSASAAGARHDRVDDLLDTTLRLFRDPTLVALAGDGQRAVQPGALGDARRMGRGPRPPPSPWADHPRRDARPHVPVRTWRSRRARRWASSAATPRASLLNGPVSAPFVDTNGDGAADTVRGVPVDAQRHDPRPAVALPRIQHVDDDARRRGARDGDGGRPTVPVRQPRHVDGGGR